MQAGKTKNVATYIDAFPWETQQILRSVREAILQAAPRALETIKYGIPTYVQGKNLVHFAGYRNHIGFYPTPGAIAHFSARLKPYKTSKGAVQFPLDMEVPLQLISEITKYRVDEVWSGDAG